MIETILTSPDWRACLLDPWVQQTTEAIVRSAAGGRRTPEEVRRNASFGLALQLAVQKQINRSEDYEATPAPDNDKSFDLYVNRRGSNVRIKVDVKGIFSPPKATLTLGSWETANATNDTHYIYFDCTGFFARPIGWAFKTDFRDSYSYPGTSFTWLNKLRMFDIFPI